MKAIILLAGAAALAIGAPAAAEHHGHHHGQEGHHRSEGHRHAEHREHARGDRHAYDRDRGDYRDRDRHYRDRDRDHHRQHYWRGERYHRGYGTYYSYNRVPWRLRHQYRLTPHYQYVYGDGYIYVIDPRTMLIVQVIPAIL